MRTANTLGRGLGFGANGSTYQLRFPENHCMSLKVNGGKNTFPEYSGGVLI